MYYLKHEQECFIGYKTRGEAERFISNEARTASVLRWLNTVFHKIENSRIRLVFLDCYFLMSNKDYRTDVKQRAKGWNLFTEGTQPSLLWQR